MWNAPIKIQDTLFKNVEKKLFLIKNCLQSKYLKLSDLERNKLISKSISPLTGYIGEILFLFNYSKFKNDDSLYFFAINEVQKSIDLLNKNKFLNFGQGLSGFLWFLSYLKKQNFIEEYDKTLEKKIIEYSFSISSTQLRNGFYDYLIGGLGVCITINELERGSYFNEIDQLLNCLISSQINDDDDFIYWTYELEKNNPYKDKTVSFGLAHGLSSIIVILTNLYINGFSRKKCRLLLTKAMDFVYSKRQYNHKNSIYPSLFIPSNGNRISSNNDLGWCYGDLCISMSLLNCYKVTSNILYKNEAKSIIDFTLANFENNYKAIKNADFCHGLSGVAHMMNRFGNYFDSNEYFEKSKNLISELLTKIKIENEVIIFFNSDEGNDKLWHNKSGVLDGISGIALTLLASISNEDPNWDKIVLTNL